MTHVSLLLICELLALIKDSRFLYLLCYIIYVILYYIILYYIIYMLYYIYIFIFLISLILLFQHFYQDLQFTNRWSIVVEFLPDGSTTC